MPWGTAQQLDFRDEVAHRAVRIRKRHRPRRPTPGAAPARAATRARVPRPAPARSPVQARGRVRAPAPPPAPTPGAGGDLLLLFLAAPEPLEHRADEAAAPRRLARFAARSPGGRAVVPRRRGLDRARALRIARRGRPAARARRRRPAIESVSSSCPPCARAGGAAPGAASVPVRRCVPGPLTAAPGSRRAASSGTRQSRPCPHRAPRARAGRSNIASTASRSVSRAPVRAGKARSAPPCAGSAP